MKRAYVDIPEGQVHYRTMGSGEPLLLLHESPTSSVTYSRVMPLLAERFRVVAMDTMGYGNSDALSRGAEIPDYGRSIVHFLEALSIEKTTIVGHHTGSVLAVEVATTRPERVLKLVLSGLAVPTDPQTAQDLSKSAMYTYQGMDEDGSFVVRRWLAYRAMCLPGAKPQTWYPAFTAAMLPAERVFDGHQAAFRYDILPRLPLIASPTLLVKGTRDMVLGDFEKMRSLIPHVTTRVVEDAGVFFALEMPEVFARIVLEFV